MDIKELEKKVNANAKKINNNKKKIKLGGTLYDSCSTAYNVVYL